MSKTNAVIVVAERRLRPIYDWLDNGNNKKAIQEADKVLKKQPELLCAQVLKGLALLRLGKVKDCEDILENVHNKSPADDCTLQAMTICYREINQLEKICDAYEKAVLNDPLNEELNTHLFMAYVRIGDYKKQQQVALNLYKIKPKNPYYFWGVMSILMQTQTSNESISQKVVLPLAERMVKKFINEGKIEAEQEIQLYIMILEMQKKYQDALDIIDSNLGQRILSQYVLPRKRIKLLQLLDKWRELNVYIKKIILEQPDSYQNYIIYFDSVFKLINCIENCDSTNKVDTESLTAYNSFKGELLRQDDSIEQCIDFIRRCQRNGTCSYKIRGPYLAMLLLYKKLSEHDYDPVKYLGNLLDLFKNYFDLFADKACCFKDLHQFLPMIQSDHVSLLSSLWISIKENDDGQTKNKKLLLMHLTHFQISRFFGVYEAFSTSEKLEQISRLLYFYYDSHEFNTNTTSTDLGCSDTFMILITHSLHDLYLETNDLKFIKDAICLLEYAYIYSRSNHHHKLLLLKFYNMLGASKAAHVYYQILEIKHMQYDSLGYLECWPLLYTGQYTLAVTLLETTLKFFTVNYKEAADQLTHAYKYGSFEKVKEFLSFEHRLKHSFHYRLVRVEHALHELIHTANHYLTVQAAASAEHTSSSFEIMSTDYFNQLVDNRDTYLFLNFDPDKRRMNETYTKLSYEHEVMLLRLRTFMFRCIRFSINICSNGLLNPNSNSTTITNKTHSHAKEVNGDLDSNDMRKFKSTVEELAETYKSILKNPIEEIPKNVLSGVDTSRLFLYSKSFFIPLFVDTMQFVHEFCIQYLSTESSEEWKLQQMADSCANAFVKIITDTNETLATMHKKCNEIKYRDLFESLSLVVELICVTSVMCGNLHSLLVESNAKSAPSKNKKKRGKEMTSSKTKTVIGSEDKTISKQVRNVGSRFTTVTREGIRDIFDKYLISMKSSIEAFQVAIKSSISTWVSLKREEFPLDQCQSHERDPAAGRTLGINREQWFVLQEEVNDHLEESYKSSLNEFNIVLTHKLEYLSMLSL